MKQKAISKPRKSGTRGDVAEPKDSLPGILL
jgi:hypothetical protein